MTTPDNTTKRVSDLAAEIAECARALHDEERHARPFDMHAYAGLIGRFKMLTHTDWPDVRERYCPACGDLFTSHAVLPCVREEDDAVLRIIEQIALELYNERRVVCPMPRSFARLFFERLCARNLTLTGKTLSS